MRSLLSTLGRRRLRCAQFPAPMTTLSFYGMKWNTVACITVDSSSGSYLHMPVIARASEFPVELRIYIYIYMNFAGISRRVFRQCSGMSSKVTFVPVRSSAKRIRSVRRVTSNLNEEKTITSAVPELLHVPALAPCTETRTHGFLGEDRNKEHVAHMLMLSPTTILWCRDSRYCRRRASMQRGVYNVPCEAI